MPLQLSPWTVSVLPLPRLPRTSSVYPFGFCGDLPVGSCSGSSGTPKHCVWRGGVAELLALPPKRRDVGVRLGRGHALPGYWTGSGARCAGGALLWRPDAQGALQPQELPATGWLSAEAWAVAGDVVVGHGKRKMNADDRPLVWRGGAEPEELPAPEWDANVTATDGTQHVGSTGGIPFTRAALWDGAARTYVDLAPPGKGPMTAAQGVGDGQQVGILSEGGIATRAVLWHGTADSRVDLTPAGHVGASAWDCKRGLQVGVVQRRVLHHTDAQGEPALNECYERAALWQGTADSFVELHGVLPPELVTSTARELRVEGERVRVFGWAQRRLKAPEANGDERGEPVAVIWEATARG
ncbi:hypothetical protein FGE12_19545 [Aggregicoccus sp. 17bor-14]|uniref:hypothetical protein n=1 Tax=Myxococcaceae TaxID=31 RepID=UPI00129C633E|nr:MULTISPECIES: hypothetical protein [Myxococcaceae]MBF5044604.1 hypothetical protein [Simulacricoccus sp. 17bor-14]MRI90348.1 hypothetical protein [Aggregicoccus sp. 17bor-14]